MLAPAVLALLLVKKPYINTRLYYAHTEEFVDDPLEYVYVFRQRVMTHNSSHFVFQF